MALDPPFIFTDAYDSGAPFDRDRCRHHCSCDVDFVGILVDGYQVNCRRDWEWCLDMKRSVQDCVSGCHNIDAGAGRLDRNGHQYRLDLDSIRLLSDTLAAREWEDFNGCDFEKFYDTLAPVVRSHPGIGELSTYDTILRLGWNYRDARISPQAFVYLHAGAYKGALALARISRSARKHYISITPDELEERRRANDVCRIDIRRFHRRLRLLDANHLENFLCIFHTPLEAYAEFLERAKLKKHNQS